MLKSLNNFKANAGDSLAGLKDAATNLAGQSIALVKQAEANV